MSDISVTVVGVTNATASILNSDSISISAGAADQPINVSSGPGFSSSGATALLVEAGANITVTTAQGSFLISGRNVPVQSVQGRTGAVVLTRTDITAAALSHTHVTSDIVGITALVSAGAPVQSVQGRTGNVTLVATDLSDFATEAAKYGPVKSVNGITGTPIIVAGSNVTVSTAGSSITISAAGSTSSGSSVTLSDATPQPLGAASAGSSTAASRADHVHGLPTISYTSLSNVPSTFTPAAHTHTSTAITDFVSAVVDASPVTSVAGRTGDVIITTADVGGLTDALANVTVDVVDGGYYTGVIIDPGSLITISAQPQNQSAEVGAVVSQSGSLPAGSWNRTFTYANSLYYAVAADLSGGDYYATSSNGLNWTKRYGLARPGSWQPLVYGGGKYAISNGTYAQISTDGVSWTEQALSGPLRFANGKWFRFADDSAATVTGWNNGKLYVSDDLSTWSSGITLSRVFSVGTALTGGGTLSSEIRYRPSNVAAVVYFGGRWLAFSSRTGAVTTASSGGVNYFRGGAWIWSSTDAATWTAVENIGGDSAVWNNGWSRSSSSSGAFAFYRPTVVNGELWVSAGTSSGNPNFAVTADGSTWSFRTIPRAGQYSYSPPQVAYGNGVYVAAWANTLWSSTNGTTWVLRTSATTIGSTSDTSTEVNFIDGYFWVVNSNGTTALRSANGVDWTAVAGLTPFDSPNRIAVGSSLLAANPGITSSSIKLTFAASTASATFTISAYYGGGTINYQWQVSADAGSTWTNISGATSATLSLSGLTAASDNGRRYRCVLSATGAATVTSNYATLTVT